MLILVIRTSSQNSTGTNLIQLILSGMFPFCKVLKVAISSTYQLVLLFCRKKLSRRLLFDKSANDDHERIILTKLKQQCGGQFTSKMEGMVSPLGFLMPDLLFGRT